MGPYQAPQPTDLKVWSRSKSFILGGYPISAIFDPLGPILGQILKNRPQRVKNRRYRVLTRGRKGLFGPKTVYFLFRVGLNVKSDLRVRLRVCPEVCGKGSKNFRVLSVSVWH